MKVGDKVRILWADGEEAIGLFLREERGFAVFEGDDKKPFPVLIRDSTTMVVIEDNNAKNV